MTPQAQGSAIFVQFGTVKLSNTTFANPGPSLDSMIVAQATIEWTCNLGQWAPLTGIIAAVNFTGCPYNCPPGTIGLTTSLSSANDCTSCPMGQQCPEAGMGAGLDCPAGQRAPVVGAQACLDCGPGTATDQVKQVSCSQCAPGFATAAEGSTTCTTCAVGEYARGNGTVACKACPAFSTTSTAGATTVQSCSCIEGYIFDIDTTGRVVCQQCRNVLEFSTTRFAGATSADDCEVRGKKYEVQSTK